MAFTAFAVGRVRVAGSDTNGAFYDASIASAGTDFSQQDAAQLTLTDLTSTASTTITSVTGGFTAAMIGNAMRISAGTGATLGYYFIITVVDTNTITVDRASGTYTDGTGKVGGAAATLKRLLNNANPVGSKIVAGNYIYVRGSGSDFPTVDDYTDTGDYLPVIGDPATSLLVKVFGENGRPRLSSNGRFWQEVDHFWVQGLYLTATGNTNAAAGIILTGTECVVRDNVFDTQNRSGVSGITVREASFFENNYVVGTTGTPSAAASSTGVILGNYGIICTNNFVIGMKEHGIGGGSGGGHVCFNIIVNCAGDGINFSGNGLYATLIENNTIDNNGGHGIYLETTEDVSLATIRNNIITNHDTSGKFGIYGELGTTAQNDRRKRQIDYNWFYNNDANYGNFTAGDNDTLDTDPEYADTATFNYASEVVSGAGNPGTIIGTASVSSREPGAVLNGSGTTDDIDLDLNKVLRLVVDVETRIHLLELRTVK